MCRQAFSITGAFVTRDRARLMAGYGASGMRGEQPSFEAYLATAAGQGRAAGVQRPRPHARAAGAAHAR